MTMRMPGRRSPPFPPHSFRAPVEPQREPVTEPSVDRAAPPSDTDSGAEGAVDAEEQSIDPEAPPSREFLRGAITQFLQQHMGNRELSPGQLEALIDAMNRARDAYDELDRVGTDPVNAPRIAALRERIARAHAETYEIAGEPLGAAGLFDSAPEETNDAP